MSEVFVGYGDSPSDTATLVLAEADKQGLPADAVRSVEGGFYVPEEVAKKAGVDYLTDEADRPTLVASDPDTYGEPAAKDVPVKKARARATKRTAKKAPAKKATSKRAAAKK